MQWNACDQKGSVAPGTVCDWTPTQKAAEIERLIEAADWKASIVTLQEICKSTFDLTLGRLGWPWTGYFTTTKLFSDDTRCRDSGKRNWALGIMVKGSIYNFWFDYLGNDPDDGETRRMLWVTSA